MFTLAVYTWLLLKCFGSTSTVEHYTTTPVKRAVLRSHRHSTLWRRRRLGRWKSTSIVSATHTPSTSTLQTAFQHTRRRPRSRYSFPRFRWRRLRCHREAWCVDGEAILDDSNSRRIFSALDYGRHLHVARYRPNTFGGLQGSLRWRKLAHERNSRTEQTLPGTWMLYP